MLTVKISGLKELQAALQQQQPKKAKAILRNALKAAAEIIRARMVANAPKASGFLAAHFGIKTRVRGDISGKAFVGPQGKMDYPFSASHPGARYKGLSHNVGRISVASVARFHEFGTSKMAAHPFMTRAFETEKENALQKIITAIRAGLRL